MEIWEGQIMKCNKEGCDGNLNPFGRQSYNYYKCDKCGKMRVLDKKEKQATLV